jgi:uncharacterized coiled-coil DUF342 family protein
VPLTKLLDENSAQTK